MKKEGAVPSPGLVRAEARELIPSPEPSHTPPAPPPDEDEDAPAFLTLRLRKKQKEEITRRAAETEISRSKFVLKAALGRRIKPRRPRVESAAIAKLESIRGLLKQIWKTGKYDTDKVFNEASKTLQWLRQSDDDK